MKKSKIAKRSGLALALEPRMMFDGAAVATAAEVAKDVNHAPETAEAVASDATVTHADATTGHEFAKTLPDNLFSDADGDVLTWNTDNLPDGLTFDSDTLTISGTPVTAGDYTIKVTATDAHGESASVDLTLDVAQNAAPEAAAAAPVVADATTGHEYSCTLPDSLFTDADGDALSWNVEGLPDGLHFDAETHTIYGTTTSAGDFTIKVTATDEAGAKAGIDVALDVAENHAPEAASSEHTAAGGTVGDSYTYTLPDDLFTDADGDALVWSVSDLPDGLHFDADTHTISGTPTSAGEHTITVTATDAAGARTHVDLTVDVAQAALRTMNDNRGITLLDAASNSDPTCSYSISSFDDATQGTYYEYTIPADLFTDADGDTLTWSVSGLPDGLHFNAATRTISGTPTDYVRETSDGYFTVDYIMITVAVDDGNGGTASTDLTLRVAEAAPIDPSINTTVTDGTCTIDSSGGITSGGSLDLFDGVNVSLDGGGNALTSLVITVGTLGPEHSLEIDGTTIQLTSTTGWSSTAGGGYYDYKVVAMNGKTTITIMLDDTISAADVGALIDGITYKVANSSVVHSGSFDVSLDLYDESGSTEATDIHATVTIDSDVNFAPEIDGDNPLNLGGTIHGTDITDATEVVYSADGHYAYVADADGHLSVLSISASGEMSEIQHLSGLTDLGSVTDMVIDNEAGAIYAISGGNIVVLKIDTNHELSYSKTVSIGDTGTDIAVSSDGKQIYVGCQWNGVSVFDVDTGTAELTHRLNVTENIGNYASITSAGQYVFFTGVGFPAVVQVYARGSDGSLTAVASINSSISDYSATFQLSVSEDGSSLFVLCQYQDYDANWNPIQVSRILAFSFDGSSLTDLGSTDIDNVTDIKVRADGQKVYVTTSDGTLQTYSSDGSGGLTLSNTVGELDDASSLSVGANGDVLVVGDMVYRLSGQQGGLYGEAIDFAGGLTISDPNLDVLNNGDGDYDGASVTVHRVGGANAADSFAFAENDGYTITGNDILKDGTVVATFANSGGELVITFKAGATTAQANAVLQQWSYSHDSSSTEAEITLQVVANDGALDSQTHDISIQLTTNTPPTLDATAEGSSNYDTAGETVFLFTNASANVGEIGQLLTEMGIDIHGLSNVSDAEYLIVDGTTIALNQNASGTTTSGYAYTYTLSGDTATLIITSTDGMTVAAAGDLVDGLTYGNTSESAMTGTRTFTITSLKDDGGTTNGGQDTASLSLASTITLAVNNAPTVDVDTGEYATDPTLYYNGGSLDGFTDYVNEVDISADGKTVIVCGSSQANANGDFTLYVYKRDTDTGALTLVQSFAQGTADDLATAAEEVDGLHHIGSAAISHNGDLVYVTGYDGDTTTCSIVLFSRDATTGELTYKGIQDTQTIAQSHSKLDLDVVLSDDGKSLYTINGKAFHYGGTSNHALVTYSIGTDGALTKQDTYTGGSSNLGVNSPTSLTISPNGDFVYVTNADSRCIGVFARDANGTLTFVKSVTAANIALADGVSDLHSNAFANLTELVVTSDGKYMYASTNNSGLVSVFSLGADGLPTYVESFDIGSTFLREVALSPDDSTLYVGTMGSSNLYICSIDAATGRLTSAGTVTVGDGAQTAHFAVSQDGKNIYIGGYLGGAGLQNAAALPVVELPHSGSGEVVIGSGISFSDADFDASGDYNGAVISIVRNGGANAADVFGFKDGNNLTLSGTSIQYNGSTIATFSDVGGTLTITFTASVTKEVANHVAQQVTYKGTGSDARIDLTVEVSDGYKAAQSSISLLYPNEVPVADSTFSLPDGRTGETYSQDLSGLFSDADGGDTLTWAVSGLAGSGLTFDANGHTISGTLTTAGEYTITVAVDDGHGGTAERTFTITVEGNTAPEADAGFTPPEGVTGHDYSCDVSGLFTDAEGDAVTLTIDPSTPLPDGLHLTATTQQDGTVTYTIDGTLGTNVTAQDYTITINAEDALGATSQATITLKVTGNTAPEVADPSFTPPEGTTGHDYSCDLSGLFSGTDADGDTVTWQSVDDSGLSGSGLTYDATTKTITGSPTTAGEYAITVTVEDGHGGTATKTLTVKVGDNAAPTVDATFELDPASYDQSYEMALPAGLFTDGDGDTITVTVDSGNPLPAGLSLQEVTLPGGATGYRIVGTPSTPGTYTVGLCADDGHGGTTTQTFTLEVGTPPSLEADATGGSTTIAHNGTVSHNDIDLFDNVTVGLDTNNEALTDLVFTVDTYGANHALVIDGQRIVLTATSGSLQTDANGYGYKVEIVDGKAVVTIDLTSSTANGVTDVQALIDGMAYRITDSNMDSTSVTVTLASLSDASGHPDHVDVSSTVVIDSHINDDPTPTDPPSDDEPTDSTEPPVHLDPGNSPGGGMVDNGSTGPTPSPEMPSAPFQPDHSAYGGSGTTDAQRAMAVFDSMISRESSAFDLDSGLRERDLTDHEGVFEANDRYASLEEIHGVWTYDVAGNRHVFNLPAPNQLGIDAPIAAYKIAWADSGKNVEGLRLDVAHWSLVSAGFKAPGHARVLVQIETSDGRRLEIPVELENMSAHSKRDGTTTEHAEETDTQTTGELVLPPTSSWTEGSLVIERMTGGEFRDAALLGKPALSAQLSASLGHPFDAHDLSASAGDTFSSGENAAAPEIAAAS